eukprot:PhF_6_TR41304/c0_g1_i8/m.62537
MDTPRSLREAELFLQIPSLNSETIEYLLGGRGVQEDSWILSSSEALTLQPRVRLGAPEVLLRPSQNSFHTPAITLVKDDSVTVCTSSSSSSGKAQSLQQQSPLFLCVLEPPIQLTDDDLEVRREADRVEADLRRKELKKLQQVTGSGKKANSNNNNTSAMMSGSSSVTGSSAALLKTSSPRSAEKIPPNGSNNSISSSSNNNNTKTPPQGSKGRKGAQQQQQTQSGVSGALGNNGQLQSAPGTPSISPARTPLTNSTTKVNSKANYNTSSSTPAVQQQQPNTSAPDTPNSFGLSTPSSSSASYRPIPTFPRLFDDDASTDYEPKLFKLSKDFNMQFGPPTFPSTTDSPVPAPVEIVVPLPAETPSIPLPPPVTENNQTSTDNTTQPEPQSSNNSVPNIIVITEQQPATTTTLTTATHADDAEKENQPQTPLNNTEVETTGASSSVVGKPTPLYHIEQQQPVPTSTTVTNSARSQPTTIPSHTPTTATTATGGDQQQQQIIKQKQTPPPTPHHHNPQPTMISTVKTEKPKPKCGCVIM